MSGGITPLLHMSPYRAQGNFTFIFIYYQHLVWRHTELIIELRVFPEVILGKIFYYVTDTEANRDY
jgi:hypothetical protein